MSEPPSTESPGPRPDFKGREAIWSQLFVMVREQFPYSKMLGVRIVEGAVVSFERVHHTRVFGRDADQSKTLPEGFDPQWQRFLRFCQEIRSGILREVHFADGRPVMVAMEEPGRDFGLPGLRIAERGIPANGADKKFEEQMVAA